MDRNLYAKVIVTTNALSPSQFQEEIPKRMIASGPLKVLEGPLQMTVDMDKNVRVSMSLCDKATARTFQPKHQTISKLSLMPSDAFYVVSFAMPSCDQLALTQPYCKCVVDQLPAHMDSTDTPSEDGALNAIVVFHLPSQAPSRMVRFCLILSNLLVCYSCFILASCK